MIDISAVGASVLIKCGKKKILIDEFSDEGTPFEAGDVDVSTNAKNLNGQMISSRTPSVFPVSITVIPGCDADNALSAMIQEASLQPGNVVDIAKLKVDSLEIIMPGINESTEGSFRAPFYAWSNGRIKTGPTGPSTSAEGRRSARTYTFEFEKYSISNGGSHGATHSM